MTAERDYLLKRYYGSSATGRRLQGRLEIEEDDYRTAPIPVNLPIGVAGNCLIWRWALNKGGYGVLRTGGKQKLAHRVAYKQAHKCLPKGAQVLHLCHRRACIQPTHLYLGYADLNTEDREARFGEVTPFQYVGDRWDKVKLLC